MGRDPRRRVECSIVPAQTAKKELALKKEIKVGAMGLGFRV